MRRKKASDFPEFVDPLDGYVCMAGSIAANSWTEHKSLRSAV
jgi:hypothetical protein